MPPTAPGANTPGGERAAPPILSRYAPSPDRPPLGTASPNASGIGSPFRFGSGEGFSKELWLQAPQGLRTARSGGRFAGESFDATATAQRAECLPRSTRRGVARSKAIRARHAEGVASGHSLASVRCRRRSRGAFLARESRFWRLGV